MKLSLIALMLFSLNSLANTQLAPPDIKLKSNHMAVFVDFLSAKTSITYDVKAKRVLAKTSITFTQDKSGYPIYDLIPNEILIKINGVKTSAKEVSLGGVSSAKRLETLLPKGTHTLYIENRITKNLDWGGWEKYAASAFWISDLSDRQFLEQYLPTNLEYDHYQTNMEIKVLNSRREHRIYTNGDLKELANNHWSIKFPNYFTASSYYFHMTKKGKIPEKNSSFRSIDGRVIPITLYTKQGTTHFMMEAKSILKELEADYGPWPHARVIIYGAGRGGMEHCGATVTSFTALGHELAHSYFARSLMPANGNSGWFDEAVASWRDQRYQKYSLSKLKKTNMANHSVYQRTTDLQSYSKGMKFVGHLAKKLDSKENFKHFLKHFHALKKHKSFNTEQLRKEIEAFYNEDLTGLFDKFIYGKQGVDKSNGVDDRNPMHPRLSESDLLRLL